MKLTKEQTLEEHRKMWNRIADQYENGRIEDIRIMKWEYIVGCEYIVGIEYREPILHNCFCCEYAEQKRSSDYRCLNCPVIWGTEVYGEFFPCEHPFSAYQKLRNESCKSDERDVNSEFCARLAREIANLPERKCV